MTDMTFPSPKPILIRRATNRDLDALAGVLAVAFGDRGDLREGLVPDKRDRRRMYPPYFRMLGAHALTYGWVDITTDSTAVAVSYLRGGGRQVPEIGDYDRRLERIFGAYADAFRELDTALDTHYPEEVEHCYLQLIAVHPDVQRSGYGSALLDHVHQRADALGLPCYLESTGAGPTALYDRHGYQIRPSFRITPGGAELTPMWRPTTGTGLPATVHAAAAPG
jgi:GNAT superfamily N-acetyltransferase